MQKTESFEDMLNESFKPQKKFELGDRISTIISGIDKENVYLDISPRVQGIVNKNEFIEDGKITVSINDEIMVYIIGKTKGFFKCTKRLGSGDQNNSSIHEDKYTIALKEAYENGVPVEGKITKVIKGGFEVTVMGKRTFCPISQIDKAYCEDPDIFLNKTYSFLISEYKEDGDDFIVSRKQLLIAETEKKANELWESIEENDIFEGIVTTVKPYGAFVDIGGIEGLLHISEIAHERINDATERLKKDDKLKVEIINIDKVTKKIGLSLKSQIEDPAKKILEDIQEGDVLEGTIVKLKPFGAFINLFPGVDGLLHISKLGIDKRIDHPKEVLNVNEKVIVKILEVDSDSGKISLTMEKEEYDYRNDLNKIKEEQKNNTESKGSMADLFKDY